MKALVVDDDLITRIVLQEILSGYAEVHSCVDGKEAVLAFRRALDRGDPYDLVCLDVLMPLMNGIEALKLIRREEEIRGRYRPQAAKVIMATASGDGDTIQQAFHELCDAYVIKPVDVEEFTNVVGCLFPIQVPGS